MSIPSLKSKGYKRWTTLTMKRSPQGIDYSSLRLDILELIDLHWYRLSRQLHTTQLHNLNKNPPQQLILVQPRIKDRALTIQRQKSQADTKCNFLPQPFCLQDN